MTWNMLNLLVLIIFLSSDSDLELNAGLWVNNLSYIMHTMSILPTCHRP